MIEVRQTDEFATWLAALRDRRGAAKIAGRIERLTLGNPGDVKRFDGLLEMRVDFGPGYRLYAVERGPVFVILLCGGDKGSQPRDIVRAKALADQLGSHR